MVIGLIFVFFGSFDNVLGMEKSQEYQKVMIPLVEGTINITHQGVDTFTLEHTDFIAKNLSTNELNKYLNEKTLQVVTCEGTRHKDPTQYILVGGKPYEIQTKTLFYTQLLQQYIDENPQMVKNGKLVFQGGVEKLTFWMESLPSQPTRLSRENSKPVPLRGASLLQKISGFIVQKITVDQQKKEITFVYWAENPVTPETRTIKLDSDDNPLKNIDKKISNDTAYLGKIGTEKGIYLLIDSYAIEKAIFLSLAPLEHDKKLQELFEGQLKIFTYNKETRKIEYKPSKKDQIYNNKTAKLILNPVTQMSEAKKSVCLIETITVDEAPSDEITLSSTIHGKLSSDIISKNSFFTHINVGIKDGEASFVNVNGIDEPIVLFGSYAIKKSTLITILSEDEKKLLDQLLADRSRQVSHFMYDSQAAQIEYYLPIISPLIDKRVDTTFGAELVFENVPFLQSGISVYKKGDAWQLQHKDSTGNLIKQFNVSELAHKKEFSIFIDGDSKNILIEKGMYAIPCFTKETEGLNLLLSNYAVHNSSKVISGLLSDTKFLYLPNFVGDIPPMPDVPINLQDPHIAVETVSLIKGELYESDGNIYSLSYKVPGDHGGATIGLNNAMSSRFLTVIQYFQDGVLMVGVLIDENLISFDLASDSLVNQLNCYIENNPKKIFMGRLLDDKKTVKYAKILKLVVEYRNHQAHDKLIAPTKTIKGHVVHKEQERDSSTVFHYLDYKKNGISQKRSINIDSIYLNNICNKLARQEAFLCKHENEGELILLFDGGFAIPQYILSADMQTVLVQWGQDNQGHVHNCNYNEAEDTVIIKGTDEKSQGIFTVSRLIFGAVVLVSLSQIYYWFLYRN